MTRPPHSDRGTRERRARRRAPRFYSAAAALLAALLAAACETTEFSPSGSADRAPWEGEVAVLDRMPPEGSFERVGVVVARGVRMSDPEDLIEHLRAAAAERGADAIVLQADVKTSRSGSGGERKALAAWAIRRAR